MNVAPSHDKSPIFDWLTTLFADDPVATTSCADRVVYAIESDSWHISVVGRLTWSLSTSAARWDPGDRLLNVIFDREGNLEHTFEDLCGAKSAVGFSLMEGDRAIAAQLLRYAQALVEWRQVIDPQTDVSWLMEIGLHSVAWANNELSPMGIAEWGVKIAHERQRAERELGSRQKRPER